MSWTGLRWLAIPVVLVSMASAGVAAESEGTPRTPIFIGSVKVRSLSEIERVLREWSVPVPEAITAEGLSQFLPFLKDAVDTARPVGVSFWWKQDLDQGRAAVIVVPLKDCDQFRKQVDTGDLKSDPNRADVFRFRDRYIRIFQDYLLLGAAPELLDQENPARVTAAFTSPEVLATGMVDLRELRVRAPDAMPEFFRQRNALKEDTNPGERMGAEWVQRGVTEYLDRMDLTFSRTPDGGYRVHLGVEPWRFGVLPRRPGFTMPDDSFLQLDWSLPAEFRQGLPKIAANFGLLVAMADENLAAEIAQMGKRLELLLGDTGHLGLGFQEGWDDPVVYYVRDLPPGADWAAMTEALLKSETSLSALKKREPEVRMEPRQLPDQTPFQRIFLGKPPTTEMVVDTMARDGRAYMLFASDTQDGLPRLLGRERKDQEEGLLSGWVDLGQLLLALRADAALRLAALDAEAYGKLSALLRRQRISFACTTGENRLDLDIRAEKTAHSALVELVHAYLRLPDRDPVVVEVEEYTAKIARQPDKNEHYRRRARALIKQNKPVEALADVNRALELLPTSSGAYWLKAIALAYLEKYQEGLDACTQGLACDPSEPAYCHVMAWYCAQRLGATLPIKAVMTHMQEARDANAGKSGTWLMCDYLLGRISEDELLEKSAASGRSEKALCEARFLLGMKCILDGRLEKGIQHFEKQADLDARTELEHWFGQREYNRLLPQFNVAIEDWKKQNRKTVACLDARKHAEALEHAEKALFIAAKLGPDSPIMGTSLGNQAMALAGVGQDAKAEQGFVKACAIWARVKGPDGEVRLHFLNQLGILIYRQNRYPEAEKIFREILTHRENAEKADGSEYRQALLNVAHACLRQGKFSEAGQCFDRAAAISRKFPKTGSLSAAEDQFYVALCHLRQESFAAATKAFAQALSMYEKAPQTPPSDLIAVLKCCAEAQQGLGNVDQAQKFLERAKQLENASAPVEKGAAPKQEPTP